MNISNKNIKIAVWKVHYVRRCSFITIEISRWHNNQSSWLLLRSRGCSKVRAWCGGYLACAMDLWATGGLAKKGVLAAGSRGDLWWWWSQGDPFGFESLYIYIYIYILCTSPKFNPPSLGILKQELCGIPHSFGRKLVARPKLKNCNNGWRSWPRWPRGQGQVEPAWFGSSQLL